MAWCCLYLPAADLAHRHLGRYSAVGLTRRLQAAGTKKSATSRTSRGKEKLSGSIKDFEEKVLFHFVDPAFNGKNKLKFNDCLIFSTKAFTSFG